MTPQPTGTITLLFTDIEGSTARWEQHPEAMRTVLARHDDLVRQAIHAHGGHHFKTIGDAFCAAFATAPDALAAALAAQRALHAQVWGAIAPLRVRMALHTGAVEARDNDYFGPPLNRVARLLAAGHGGQTLLSEVSYGLVRDALPTGLELRDLGEHRLKDLIRPERVFMLLAPDLPTDFAPLQTLNSLPNNLPLQRAALIGRERELHAVRALLLRPDVAFVTLTGTGGTGKTRLALQVAADLLDTFPDGVWFINLAPLSDPQLVVLTIAQTLGVGEAGGQPLLETLQAYLRDTQLLLVLDNFEQVVAAAEQVAALLASARNIKVLVTSRVPLHLYNEHEYPVPPLALPDLKQLPAIERLTQYEAVRLFIQRAEAVKPEFAVTNSNAPAIAEICARLDGLPLAIELAAARVKLLPPQALLQRLKSRLATLTGGAIDLPQRQQTLRNTLDWSYSLLAPAGQTLFARLAVFVGGRTFEAIEAVCNAEGDLALDVLDGIGTLLDNSLLRQEDGPNDEPRFVMLETIHEYARERLAASGEAETLRLRHAEYFLALAQQAEEGLQGPHQASWLSRLEMEHDNFRAALRGSLEHGEGEIAARLSTGLHFFWKTRSYVNEARGWFMAVLATDTLPPSMRAVALISASSFAQYQGDFDWARAALEESITLSRQQANTPVLVRGLSALGNTLTEHGEFARAEQLLEESLSLVQHLGDKYRRYDVLNSLGCLMRDRGDFARATMLLEQSLELGRELGDQLAISIAFANLGSVAHRQGDYAQAKLWHTKSLILAQELDDNEGFAFCFEGLAGVAGAQGQAERAAGLFGAAEALRESINMLIPPTDRLHYERMVAAACSQLDAATWAAAWAEGRALSLKAAIVYALAQE